VGVLPHHLVTPSASPHHNWHVTMTVRVWMAAVAMAPQQRDTVCTPRVTHLDGAGGCTPWWRCALQGAGPWLLAAAGRPGAVGTPRYAGCSRRSHGQQWCGSLGPFSRVPGWPP
jgi:hypothetical protein